MVRRPRRFDDEEATLAPIAGLLDPTTGQNTGDASVISHAPDLSIEDVSQTAAITRTWGEAILTEPHKVRAILDAQSIVREASMNMMQAGLNVGRAMNELQSQLSSDEFNRGLRASHAVFHGWSAGNINKAMRAARFIDDNRPLAPLAPQSFSVIYEFTTLDADDLKKAVDLRLFRPDVRRADVQAFKKKIKASDQDKSSETSPFKVEIDRLDRRLQELQVEMALVQRKRSALAAKESAWRSQHRISNR